MSDPRALLEKHGDGASKLTVQKISVEYYEEDDPERTPPLDFALIEGDSESFRFLGKLFLDFADGDMGCSFRLHPQAAGCAHFHEASGLGLYMRKEPCDEE